MPEPLTWAEDVRPEWIDYNGHLSEGYYVLVFGFANDAAMVALGMTSDYLAETATSLFTLEAHVRYLDQVPPGAHGARRHRRGAGEPVPRRPAGPRRGPAGAAAGARVPAHRRGVSGGSRTDR